MIDIGWLAQNGLCKKYPAGEIIPSPVDMSDEEKAMYILLSGKVDVYANGGNAPAEVSLSPGDVFGGHEFFTGTTGNVYAATTDSVVYVITEESFADLSWSQPDIVFELLRAAYIAPGKPADPMDEAREKIVSVKEKAAAAKKAAQDAKEAKAAAEAKTTGEAAKAAGQAAKTAGEGKTAGQAAKTAREAKTAGEAAKNQKDGAAAGAPPATITAIPVSDPLFPEGHKQYPGITKPEYERLIYPKEYVCPFCKKTFKDYKVFSSKLYEAAPMRSDLRRFYVDFQHSWYDIITCVHCYFSAVQSYYVESKPVFKQKIEHELAAARASVFLDFDAPRDVDFVFTSHYLALLCADGYLSSAIPARAKIWGNLSWLYEDVGDVEMEKFAAEKAAAAYEEVYSGTRLTPVQEQTTCLAIAGMQRRAGIDRDIRKLLFKVITTKMGEKAYVKLAEEMMDDIKAQK